MCFLLLVISNSAMLPLSATGGGRKATRLKYSRNALHINVLPFARYCQGTQLNTQDTLKSISKEIGFFYFVKKAIEQATLKSKSKDGN